MEEATPKVRGFRKRDVGIPRHHPDGGTLRLYTLDLVRSTQLQDELAAIDYEIDNDGNVKIDEETQLPVKRGWQSDAERVTARIRVIRKMCVAGADNFVDADDPTHADGTPKFMTMTDAMIEAFLAEISVRPVEREFPITEWNAETQKFVAARDADNRIKTERRTVPANEAVFAWAMEEAAKLGSIGEAAEQKNSSSTPKTDTATAAQ